MPPTPSSASMRTYWPGVNATPPARIVGGNPGQMLTLDPFGDMLRRRMRDLVAEHCREPGVVLGQRQDARVDDDLPARQAVRVGLVLAEQRHLPDERRLVSARHGLDPPGNALHLRVPGPEETIRARFCASVFAYSWLPSCICCASVSADALRRDESPASSGGGHRAPGLRRRPRRARRRSAAEPESRRVVASRRRS